MNKGSFIKLPVAKKDGDSNWKTKDCFFEADFFKGKVVRDWEDNGKVSGDKCALHESLDFQKGAYTLFGLSASSLVDRLNMAGIYNVVI